MRDIHVIGYSLGCHVANYIAKELKPYKLPRITALDPPAMLVPDEEKLDVNDAEFIDSLITSALTLGQNMGHAAFVFNGGILQPGCFLSEYNGE